MLQTKDTDWLNGCKNRACIYAVYKRPISDQGTHTELKVRAWKNVFHSNGNQKKVGVAISYQTKETLNKDLVQKTKKDPT